MENKRTNIQVKVGIIACFLMSLLWVKAGYAQEDEGPVTKTVTVKPVVKKDSTKKPLTKKERRAKRRLERKIARKRKREADTTWKPIRIAGLRFGADILPTAFAQFDENRTSYQGTFELLLNNKYSIELSGGIDEVIRRGAGEYKYTSNGSYGRLGINYNLLHKKSDDDFIYVGLHFGYAQFNHDITYTIVNPLGNVTQQLAENQLFGTWMEFNFGFRIELFKNLYMGPMFRIKAKLTGSEGELLTPSDIPGYGTNNGANFNFGYHLMYRIPLRKSKGSKRTKRLRRDRRKAAKKIPKGTIKPTKEKE
ncbi:hypothetical protein BKI52_31920 [marine bacterium AO1-C]|nr:hypothetical protein BKI52_31920 [marine bacterium AO1-C]